MEQMQWAKIPGYENYVAYRDGRIFSVGFWVPRGEAHTLVWKEGRCLKPATRKRFGKPYCQTVNLSAPDGSKKTHRIHRLILTTFVGPCPEGMEGCHNDGDPTNNALRNLRWDTKKANIADCVAHGTKRPPPIRRGEAHHNTTLTRKQVADIRRPKYRRGLHAELGRKYGVSGQTIRRIRDRLVWR